ncbi:MAG TPA: universal stress protein [Polyangiaceae bacterium]|jgi:nucleotide-binding universal stress UspA family protein
MKRILVGLDGSERAPMVLAAAAAIAQAQGAKLVLLRAVGLPPDVPQDFWKSTDESLLDLLRHRAQTYLNEQARTVLESLVEKTAVVIGAPWQAVCDAARHDRADLVVVGSHGYGGLDRVLGTTAAKVVDHCPCSVLVVRRTPAP